MNSKHCILYLSSLKGKNVQIGINYSLKTTSRDGKTIVKTLTRENVSLSCGRVLKRS